MQQLTQTRLLQMQRCRANLSRLQPCISVNSVRTGKRALRVRASGEDKNERQQNLQTKEKRYSRMVEELSKTGMTPAKAKDTLRIWAELGAKDPEQLKQLLVKRSLAPLTALAVQSVLDFVACGGGFYIGRISGQADFPGAILISLLGYFFACYYFLQAVFQITALTSLGVAARRYSTDAAVLLEAVRQLAGPASGLSVVDSAALVVNTLKVIQTLEKIGEQLQDITAGTGSSLSNLSAYLTLQRAEEMYGFEPAKYGLSEAQAADIAGVFSRYDTNEDGRLEQSELRRLCSQLGTDISDAEAKEAVRILDSGSTGYIQFGDFVEWYMGRRPSREVKDAALKSSK
ncbi:hypothetical protein COO60DRAFT_1503069 [Scenedesmus sp. NREL 46B-D3]|nr:hypothetical protein COO60DRAFT_1503069 [Scenedesmus sp. NREL 46B-D3]